jgi:DNA-binding winged helix-turn-helix (wHTH) protein/TolB-like protein
MLAKPNLAQEPDFELGGVCISPSAGLMSRDALVVRVEPRVMQVFLTLVRAEHHTVSRDQLIETCWDGRIVTDNAISRALAELRGIARQFEPPPFVVHTIPKVGFRLEAAQPGHPPAPEKTEQKIDATIDAIGALPDERPNVLARGLGRSKTIAVAALLGVVLVGIGSWFWLRPAAVAREPRIALAAFEPLDAQTGAFAKRLTDEVAGVLNENIAGLAPPAPDISSTGADLKVGGSAQREGDKLHVRAFLEDGRNKVTLWSRQYDRPAGEEEQLRTQVAVDLSDILLNAMEPLQQKGLKIDSRALALWLTATGIYRQGWTLGDPRVAARAYEQVVERAPNFAAARGMMAQSLALASLRVPPDQKADLRRRVRTEAERAIRTDPIAAEGGYDALYWLARGEVPADLAKAEDIWAQGLSRSPNLTGGRMRHCELLLDVGRAKAALPDCERAAALRPLGAPWGYRYARALDATHQTEKADQVTAREIRLHPQHWWIRRFHFQRKAFSAPPAQALALLRDPTQPPAFSKEEADALEVFLLARASGVPADADQALARLGAVVERGGLSRSTLVKAMVALGRLDEAFAAATPAAKELGPVWLFDPGLEAMQRDARFWPLAARIGLLGYWRTRGVWPDFCSEAGIDCATQAARVSSL